MHYLDSPNRCGPPAKTLLAGVLAGLVSLSASAQTPFTSGNLVVFQAASATANNTTCSVLEINNVSGTLVQTIAIPGTGTGAIRVSGSATSTGYMANSDDGSLVALTGHNSTSTAFNANTLNPRAAVALNVTGNYIITATYTGGSGNQTRCATTLDNATWFMSDQGGIYTNTATAADPSGNYRGLKSFGGTIYVGRQSATAVQVGTLSLPPSGSVTDLPGLGVSSQFQDFYLVQSGANGTTYDLLYITRNSGAIAGSVDKYSLVSGSWVANGTYVTAWGGYGLCAARGANGVDLYVTSGNGATAANTIRKLTDTAGHNMTIAITSPSTLYTTAAGTTLKGLAFAPKCVTTTADSQVIGSDPATAEMQMTFVNPSGLNKVGPTVMVNCTIAGEAFDLAGNSLGVFSFVGPLPVTPFSLPAGTTKLVMLASKVNSGTNNAVVNVLVEDSCGVGKSFDPIITTVEILSGNTVRQRFEGLPAPEGFLFVRNGTPGLERLDVDINGRVFTVALTDGQEVASDLRHAMLEGDDNVVTLTGYGAVGSSAFVTLTDTPTGQEQPIEEIVRLTLAHSPAGLTLQWPETLEGWSLQSAATPDGAWTSVTTPPLAENGQWTVTVTPTAGAQFFRLTAPTVAARPATTGASATLNPQPQPLTTTHDGLLW